METRESTPTEARRLFLSSLGRLAIQAYQTTLAKPAVREVLIGIAIFCALVAIMQVGLVPQQIHVVVGQPAAQMVLAPRDTEDPFETERQRKAAARRAMIQAEKDQTNWYIAPESGVYAETRLDQFLNDVDQARSSLAQAGRQVALDSLHAKWTGVSAGAWEGLLTADPGRLDQWRAALGKVLVSIEENDRIGDGSIEGFRDELPSAVAQAGGDPKDEVLIGALRGLVKPNLVLDRERLSRLAEQARQQVAPVIYRSGDPILEKNQIVTKEKLQMLRALRLVAGGSNVPLAFLSMVLFVLVLIALAVGYLYRFHRETLRQERLLYLVALTMTIAAILGKFLALNVVSNLAYLAPVTFASILWVLLLDPQVALMLTVLLSMLMGVVTGFQLSMAIYTLIGGCTAVFVLYQRRQRSDLMRSGLFIAVANVFSVLLLALLSGVFPPIWRIAFAAINGFSAAVVAIGLLPFLENLFGLTSAIRLLELANPNQPLLRQLLIEAPGTYHHSIMVGNLAEAAADVVGADALLVRVGAYYHDVGKSKRPYFFVENQIAQDNPHEKLTPTLSTLIITAHVKEGVELARQAGLPEAIVDILEQHHGTDLVRYFYARAAENAQSDLAETDFRYDGPRPQTKEAALVMLADSVEAAVRAMVKPTPAKIEALTARILKERLDDGQFDECDLTLRDLEGIRVAFLKVLGGIFHTRIEYPESVLREFERKKGTNGDLRKQPAG